MKRAGLVALLLGFALIMPGCGFKEGADAVVTVVKATPTPIPTPSPTPEPTPTPAPTPEPAVVSEETGSGIKIDVKEGDYVADVDVNMRSDASAEAELLTGITAGTSLKSTGVCENGWIRVEYDGKVGYVHGDYVSEKVG